MGKIEVTKEQHVCDRCGAKITARGMLAQFIDGVLKFYEFGVGGLSFHTELCRSCGEGLKHWWTKKAGEA